MFHALREDNPAITELACICQACNTWVRRRLEHNPNGTQPAKKKRAECDIEQCTEPLHAEYKRSQLTGLSGMVPSLDITRPQQNEYVNLCKKHYNQVYSASQSIKCFSCGKIARRKEELRRPINAQCLTNYLNGEPLTKERSASGRLCDTCYTKEHKAFDGLPSTDAALKKLAQSLETKRNSLEKNVKDNVVDYAVTVVSAVLAKLQHNEACLLMVLFRHFSDILREHGQEEYTKSAYLLAHLKKTIGTRHLATRFINGTSRKGYPIFHAGGDIHHALFCALQVDADRSDNNGAILLKSSGVGPPSTNSDMEETVLQGLRGALHQQAKQWAEQGSTSANLQTMVLNKVIAEMDQRLWKAIWALTTPNTSSSRMSDQDTPRSWRLSCLFMLAAMAHAAVPTCHFPLHLVLTDYIESKSGSAELIQVLSRLGICRRVKSGHISTS